jgi:hypothetical protein
MGIATLPRMTPLDPERLRLAEHDAGRVNWKRWGTYVSERAWGTVREDYSANGDAWNYFTHDHARSRAYRWNEDGLGGFCDERQRICLAVALWNERDPFLKERMFGLSNSQGNHGEDVKEYYFFLDGTPTHSYMKMVYKYPQVAFPYDDLVAVNGARGQKEREYELFDALRDTFLANRYFDIVIEYAKADAEDVLCRITAINRGPKAAPIRVLPHLWYRNIWSWSAGAERPVIRAIGPGAATTEHPDLGPRWWYVQTTDGRPADLQFTENDTNTERLFQSPNPSPYVKDGINDAVVQGSTERVNARRGSKVAGHLRAVVPPDGSFTVQVRFTPGPLDRPFAGFEAIFDQRVAEADAFYAGLHPAGATEDERRVQRQAFAGLLWSKQFYRYHVFRWLVGDPTQPTPPAERWDGRNARWKALNAADVLLMPDTWEYPWFASWDLAFHCAAIAWIDPGFAKQQLLKMGHEWYQHGNGQFPAYEWNFDDVNPPVLGAAAWRVYQVEKQLTGKGDLAFLREMFQSEMLCFSFWVNRKDASGRDVFGGGFLGMDNIGVVDRDEPLPNGAELEQSDGTSWMARFAITMLSMSLELARTEPFYQNMAVKYFEHFLYIAHAMTNMDGEGIDLWDKEDQFFYDVIHLTSGQNFPLRIRSMVGIVPLFATLVTSTEQLRSLAEFQARADWFIQHRPDLLRNVAPWRLPGPHQTTLLAILHDERLKAVLKRVLDPAEFLSDYGVRALSRYHKDHPYVLEVPGRTLQVEYQPAESDNRLFGGNSNWRGPVWFPVNYMIVQSLREFHKHYGDTLKVEYPTGSGQMATLGEVAAGLASRLTNLFLRDPARNNRRAAWGDNDYFQTDPHWRDCIPFFEYFHGDSGAGLGASHQTGWTALVAALMLEQGAMSDPHA